MVQFIFSFKKLKNKSEGKILNPFVTDPLNHSRLFHIYNEIHNERQHG